MMIKVSKKGDVRIIKRFAWLPVELTHASYKIWLKFYYQTQVYGIIRENEWSVFSNRTYSHPANGKIHSWRLW